MIKDFVIAMLIPLVLFILGYAFILLKPPIEG
jgi:hypothetical protein